MTDSIEEYDEIVDIKTSSCPSYIRYIEDDWDDIDFEEVFKNLNTSE